MTLVPVLLYHAVTARPPPGLERFTVAPHHFADHLRVLRDAGRVGLTVSQYAACLRNGPVLPELPVVVTFDDGYADFLDAAERLGIAGLPATLYMTTGQIGAAGMLTRRQLQSLGASVEVGAHSRTHPGWTSLPPAAPRRGPRVQGGPGGPSPAAHAQLRLPARRPRPAGPPDGRRRRIRLGGRGQERVLARARRPVRDRADHRHRRHHRRAHRAAAGGTRRPGRLGEERRRTRAYRSYRRVRRRLRREVGQP